MYTLQIDPVTAYTITYYANGGSGTVPSTYTTKVHDVALTLPNASNSTLTRDGYTLISWNTAADGSGTSYSLGGTFTVNADTTLYAIWRQNYVAPTITDVQVFRTTSSGTTQTDDGTYVYVKFNYTNAVENGTSKAPSCTIKIGSSSYTPSISGGSVAVRYGTFSANNTYAVTITLSNSGYESYATTYDTTIPSASYPMDILGTGQAMGLMHVAVSGQPLTLANTTVDGSISATSASATTGTFTTLNATTLGFIHTIDASQAYAASTYWNSSASGDARYTVTKTITVSGAGFISVSASTLSGTESSVSGTWKATISHTHSGTTTQRAGSGGRLTTNVAISKGSSATAHLAVSSGDTITVTIMNTTYSSTTRWDITGLCFGCTATIA